jgi:hypothetical protein
VLSTSTCSFLSTTTLYTSNKNSIHHILETTNIVLPLCIKQHGAVGDVRHDEPLCRSVLSGRDVMAPAIPTSYLFHPLLWRFFPTIMWPFLPPLVVSEGNLLEKQSVVLASKGQTVLPASEGYVEILFRPVFPNCVLEVCFTGWVSARLPAVACCCGLNGCDAPIHLFFFAYG